jgi:hypothetical protein
VVGAITIRAWGTAARAATTLGDGVRLEKTHRVQRAGAIQPDNHVLGCKILHRQTKRVKFHRAPVVSGKTTNREETLNHVRSKQDIVKVKGLGKN